MKKGLFIGLTTIDIQYFVDHYPLPNTKLKTDSPLVAVGGPAANAAITFSVLGGRADFLTCIGSNTFTDIINNDFDRYNVSVIDQLEGQSTDPIISAVITTLSNSDRTIITHHPQELTVPTIPNKIKPLEEYDFIFIDGFYPELSRSILPDARRRNISVIFDGGSWKPHLPQLLNYVDIAICSANFHPPGCEADHNVISTVKSFGVKNVAISRGEKSIVCEKETIEINNKVDAVDSLGAGDVLHGAFCWYNSHPMSFVEALAEAAKVASFSVQFRGTHQWIEPFSNGKCSVNSR